jgi:hypothetical protein
MAEREVVETARGDLIGRDDDLVVLGLARDRDRAVDDADPPGGGRVRRVGSFGRRSTDPQKRTVWRALGREDLADHDEVEDRQVDRGTVRIDDRDQIVVGPTAGHRREVVGTVDRGPVEAVMGARDDDRADPRLGQTLEFGGDALDRATGLDVRVEQVTGDQEDVGLLADGGIDRCLEGCELAFALGGRLLSQIVVSRTEMDVRGVDDPEHRVAAFAS